MTNNLLITSAIDLTYFELVFISRANSEIIIKAIKPTPKLQKTIITSSLDKIESDIPKFTYDYE